jgi:hypothetical protein
MRGSFAFNWRDNVGEWINYYQQDHSVPTGLLVQWQYWGHRVNGAFNQLLGGDDFNKSRLSVYAPTQSDEFHRRRAHNYLPVQEQVVESLAQSIADVPTSRDEWKWHT